MGDKWSAMAVTFISVVRPFKEVEHVLYSFRYVLTSIHCVTIGRGMHKITHSHEQSRYSIKSHFKYLYKINHTLQNWKFFFNLAFTVSQTTSVNNILNPVTNHFPVSRGSMQLMACTFTVFTCSRTNSPVVEQT